jgi:hypothetical protein
LWQRKNKMCISYEDRGLIAIQLGLDTVVMRFSCLLTLFYCFISILILEAGFVHSAYPVLYRRSEVRSICGSSRRISLSRSSPLPSEPRKGVRRDYFNEFRRQTWRVGPFRVIWPETRPSIQFPAVLTQTASPGWRFRYIISVLCLVDMVAKHLRRIWNHKSHQVQMTDMRQGPGRQHPSRTIHFHRRSRWGLVSPSEHEEAGDHWMSREY